MSQCPEQENLFNSLLERNNSQDIAVGEKQHLAACETCQKRYNDLLKAESCLISFPNEIINDISKNPIKFSDIEKASHKPGGPSKLLITLLAVITAVSGIVMFYKLQGQAAPTSQKQLEETKPAVVLPADCIAELPDAVKKNPDGSFAADKARIVKNGRIFMNFTDAAFRFTPSGIELYSGRIDVETPPGQSVDFSITTFNSVISVKGTVFSVELKSDKITHVSVSRGLVEVVNIHGSKMLLKHSEECIISADGQMNRATQINEPGEKVNQNHQGMEETASAAQMLNE